MRGSQSASFLVVALLAVLGASVICGCASDSVEPETMQTSCLELAARLGMDSEGPITVDDSGKLIEVRQGELKCVFTHSGDLKRIRNTRLHEVPLGATAIVADAEAAHDIAIQTLREIDIDMAEAYLSPEPPWVESEVLVSVVAEPEAYGYPTHGFAGRTEVRVNRFTGKVAGVVKLIGGVCDPPNIQVTEADAKRIAEEAWARSSQKKDGVEYRMVLQYYVPSEDEATPQGNFYRERKRVRLCWVAAYYIPLQAQHVKPIGDVVIDSETGELLSVPD